MEHRTDDVEADDGRPEVLDWTEIREPGSYLHLATGLIARIYGDDRLLSRAAGVECSGSMVARLATNPGAPLPVLRRIAERHGWRVNS